MYLFLETVFIKLEQNHREAETYENNNINFIKFTKIK